MPAKSGRPAGGSQARQSLIDAARERFAVLPYEQVSTRMIANRAGVNAALIRYYFGSKAGLFEQMLRETIEPMKCFFDEMERDPGSKDVEQFIRTYFRVVAPYPDLPKLIIRIMSDPAAEQRPVVEKVLGEMTGLLQSRLFDNPRLLRGLQAGIDPSHAKMTVLSLTLFPFIIPEAILKLHGFTLDGGAMKMLLEHNIHVLKNGLLSADKVEL